MYQDYEGFPSAFYGESYLDPALWEYIDMDEDDNEMLEVHTEYVGPSNIDDARDACYGTCDNPEDWAFEYLNETGMLNDVPDDIKAYIDYESYARDSGMIFARRNGKIWVFNNI
ncbi:MAG: antirestriction protein ArdA [Chloroflexi bacterium]|nr:antirestriction protein ArdA [Chloroflexota bacterium]